MRDLEICGAGNRPGTQQSGHIATVGYELSCRLLEQAVRGLEALPPAEPPFATARGPPTSWAGLVPVDDDRDALQTSPDDPPA